MKVKINHTLFITLSLITLLIAGNYWGIAQFVLPYKARLYILVLSGAIPLLLPLYYKKRSIRSCILYCWYLCSKTVGCGICQWICRILEIVLYDLGKDNKKWCVYGDVLLYAWDANPENPSNKNSIHLHNLSFYTFEYPQVDESKCVRCYQCIKVCPIKAAKAQ